MINATRVYLEQNVYDAALDRIRRIFDEFDEVIVNFSGGKDSTVTLNLALHVAEEKGRLPVKVLFLDQEAEWDHVVDYIRSIMNDPRVEPLWFQGPFKIFNATSGDQPWLYCWQEGAEWLRDKEPNSIHENKTGTDRFAQLFTAFLATYFPTTKTANLAGVRAEESPGRLKGLTSKPTYKDITWGRTQNRQVGHYTFYPLYDWSYMDIWKAIHDHGWPYCKLYDYMYNHGIPVLMMRVSNVHHETAVHALKFLQEIEPDTWNRITDRVSGVNAVSKVGESYSVPKELPWMFASWQEYRDHLLENLIEDSETREIFRRQFVQLDKEFRPEIHTTLAKAEIAAMLVNDYHGTKLGNWKVRWHNFAVKSGTKKDKYSYQGALP